MAKEHNPRFVAFTLAARDRVRETTVEDVRRRSDAGDSFVLIDIREDHEWAEGHVPNAVHLGKGIIEREIETLVPDVDAPIVLYCGGGFRSAIAADALTQMGYTNVESMDGGFTGWKEAGFDVIDVDI